MWYTAFNNLVLVILSSFSGGLEFYKFKSHLESSLVKKVGNQNSGKFWVREAAGFPAP
jgi:hypothetical protein